MRTPKTRCPGIGLAGSAAAVALLLVWSGTGRLLAEDFEFDFDGPGQSWQVRCRETDAKLTIQERRREAGHRGGAELIRLKVVRDNVPLRFEHEIPTAQVLDELEARLWVRSDCAGAVLALRIGFRGLTDPETGAPLSTIVTGDAYQTPGQWQELKCRTSDKAVNDQLRLLRARKRVTIDPATMFVDRVIVGCNLSAGTAELLLDDLTIGPIVPVEVDPRSDRSVMPVGAKDSDRSNAVPVEFRLHRLRVEGKPFLPRIAVYHDERPEALAAAGFNVAWVSDVEATAITGPLRRQGLWLTAIPPFAKDNTGEPLDSEDASLLPFAPGSSSVLFWMMGARLTATGRPRLQSWTNQVRDADRVFKRPLAADVADDERLCSRHLDLLGISRHVMNSEVTLLDYRESLVQKRDRAWPGTLCWTWIQTEPSPELMDLAPSAGTTPLLEPEQIRAQVYAALAAGCRGVGYWTTTPLDGEGTAARERLLTLTQLNLELALLEPWLATGSSVQLIPFTVDARHAEQPAPAMTKTLLGGKSADRKPDSAADKQRERELTAALIRSEFGALLLPMWLEDRSQFVPGQLAASNATIIVPGGGETASAWEITTTGRLQNLARETVAGGIKIVLPRFDQTAAILITSDQSVVEQLNQRILAMQDRSAAACVELSQLKLERVRQVDQQLQQLGVGLPEARRLLEQAKQHSNNADAALKQQQYQSARQHAADAMQLARMLQRAHWENAVKKLPSPVVSPHALSFQTLPAHWRLMRGMPERSLVAAPNKLPSGEFEDLDTLIAAGWRHEQRAIPGVQSAAELHPSAKQGQYSLRLAAQSTADEQPPVSLNKIPVTVVSPPLSVHAGQVVRISGWVKLPQAVLGSLDGATIHDSLLGKTGAWQVKAARDWQRFELLRVVPESQDLTVTISLHGLGELAIDDLQIVAFAPPAEVAESPSPSEPAVKPAKFSPLDVLDLRRLNPLPKRK
ncbi:MAG: hypothetical protein AABP62_12625 [Planctomycetota bacterium]